MTTLTETVKYNGKMMFNFFRSLPLIAIVAVASIMYYYPFTLKYELNTFATNVEGGDYWGLYFITIPILIAALPLFWLRKDKYKSNYPVCVFFCLTYPLAVGFSVWLWELLGIALMFFYLLGLSIAMGDMNKDSSADKKEYSKAIALPIIGSAIYLLARLLGTHTGNLDILLLAAMAIFILRHSITTLFVDNSGDSILSGFLQRSAKTKYKFEFFFSVPLLISIFFVVALIAVQALERLN